MIANADVRPTGEVPALRFVTGMLALHALVLLIGVGLLAMGDASLLAAYVVSIAAVSPPLGVACRLLRFARSTA